MGTIFPCLITTYPVNERNKERKKMIKLRNAQRSQLRTVKSSKGITPEAFELLLLMKRPANGENRSRSHRNVGQYALFSLKHFPRKVYYIKHLVSKILSNPETVPLHQRALLCRELGWFGFFCMWGTQRWRFARKALLSTSDIHQKNTPGHSKRPLSESGNTYHNVLEFLLINYPF